MSKETKKIPLVECFGPTVQGEGAVIGQQTYFLRFGLCDYECEMCDSLHAVKPDQVKKNAQWLTQDEIYDVLTKHRAAYGSHSTNWVTFSGGNPCIHDLAHLTNKLNEDGWEIAVETQGTLHPRWLRGASLITCSPKGPGMGENTDVAVLDQFIQDVKSYHDKVNLKIVLFDQRDINFAAELFNYYVSILGLFEPEDFYLSLGNPYPPHVEVLDHPRGIDLRSLLMDRYEQMLNELMAHPVLSRAKFLPQLHVLMWGNKQGV